MRILLWHGWLLEGAGSNVYTARTAEAYRRAGHDVALLCQESNADRLRWVDAVGTVDAHGVHDLVPTSAPPGEGRVTLLRPEIGTLLPVFVFDEYEGFEVKRFVDLTTGELDGYLSRNVAALAAATSWHGSNVVVTGHVVPGAVIARRALGPGRYVAKVHGSDLEYAVRIQARYLDLAREGLEGAIAVTGASRDVLARTEALVPSVAGRTGAVPPGVEVERFRLRPRDQALEEAAAALDQDPDTVRGRPDAFDAALTRAVTDRDAGAIDELARGYDQAVPDPSAASRLRRLIGSDRPLVGFFGKLIPPKGVHLLLAALPSVRAAPNALVIGFGLAREWLQALVAAMDRGEAEDLRWLASASDMPIDLSDEMARSSAGLGARVTFTGRLDHRYAGVLAALDVLVVPSVLDEAFGMVAAEGAASGALPLVARHSGLAEIADALEGAVGRRGLFSFEPGPDARLGIAAGLDRLLQIPAADRRDLRESVSGFAASQWTWERTAERLLQAATGVRGSPPGQD